MNLSRYFSHCRDTDPARPWFAIAPVMASAPDGKMNRVAGVYVTIRRHTFAIHRGL